MKSKLNIAAFVFLALGFTSGLLEKTFYGGRLDENNVVQDSLFLPLFYIFILIALSLWTLFIVIKATRLLKRR